MNEKKFNLVNLKKQQDFRIEIWMVVTLEM